MAGVLVHEWLGPIGGSEKVLDVLAEIYPEADIYCLWDDAGNYSQERLFESFLARTPLRRKKALALPAMPFVWRQMRSTKKYDWMLVSSHLFAHHARFRGRNASLPKYVYAHTPARYIWEPELDRRGEGLFIKGAGLALKYLDRIRAAEPIEIAANSKFVAERIRKSWNRDARVIYPPVDTERISSNSDWASTLSNRESEIFASLPAEFVLGASRFVRYKSLDIVIRAAELSGLPAVIAGSGEGEATLRARAAASSVPVYFVVKPTDAMLYALYQKCSVYVFPPVEDFGIMPVEAAAAGAPVVANRLGGTSETVVEGITGHLATMQDELELKVAVEHALELDRRQISETASRFSAENFRRQMLDWLPTDSLSESSTQKWK
ncbi:glycosyltransferase [Micrococcaceae bacterium Sec5.1]